MYEMSGKEHVQIFMPQPWQRHYVLHLYVHTSIPEVLSMKLLLFQWSEIDQTYSQYLPYYVVVCEDWNLHLHILPPGYGPLLHVLLLLLIT